jgi:methionyl-tRNA formyltransferase
MIHHHALITSPNKFAARFTQHTSLYSFLSPSPMRIHIFTTDASAFELSKWLPVGDLVEAVIVPNNRSASEKVRAVQETGKRLGIPVFEHARGKTLPKTLPEADAAISWLYSQIIKSEDLTNYPKGMLNMHGGRIPEYRGANVLQWQIINGEKELGITWHEIVEAVDAGPIWAESTIPIAGEATALAIREAMIREGINLFATAWQRATKGGVAPRLPDLTGGRVWPSRRPKDGIVQPGMTTVQIQNFVRALCPPWPPATIHHQDQWYEISAVSSEIRPDSIAYKTADGAVVYLQATLADPQ